MLWHVRGMAIRKIGRDEFVGATEKGDVDDATVLTDKELGVVRGGGPSPTGAPRATIAPSWPTPSATTAPKRDGIG